MIASVAMSTITSDPPLYCVPDARATLVFLLDYNVGCEDYILDRGRITCVGGPAEKLSGFTCISGHSFPVQVVKP